MARVRITVTLDERDVSWLRRRAKAAHRGELSAAVQEVARALRKRDALAAFLQQEGVPTLSGDELDAIQSEWRAPRRHR
jgi:hypothetical protein